MVEFGIFILLYLQSRFYELHRDLVRGLSARLAVTTLSASKLFLLNMNFTDERPAFGSFQWKI
jgi:hypothetical protein